MLACTQQACARSCLCCHRRSPGRVLACARHTSTYHCVRAAAQRYRALFALRNRGGPEAVDALGAAFGCSSALLKHEVAYVMGQMQHPASAAVLCDVLQVRVCVQL